MKTHETVRVPLVTLDAPDITTPAIEELDALLTAAGLPIASVRVLHDSSPWWNATQVLEGELSDHIQSYVARDWSAYKAQLHTVTAAGGVDGTPVPFFVSSPLCKLDEDVVALVNEAWQQAFRLGMAITRAMASGGVAVRLPDVVLCSRCVGDRVIDGQPPSLDDPICPECDGEGVVQILPELVILAGASLALPLPVRVVQT